MCVRKIRDNSGQKEEDEKGISMNNSRKNKQNSINQNKKQDLTF